MPGCRWTTVFAEAGKVPGKGNLAEKTDFIIETIYLKFKGENYGKQ